MTSKPLRVIESVPVPMEQFIIGSVVAAYCAFGVVFATLFLGGFVAGMLRLGQDLSGPAVIAFVVAFPLVLLWWRSRVTGRETYTLYPDRLEVTFADQLVIVPFDQVTRVKLRQRGYQRRRGIGTVTLELDPAFARGKPIFVYGQASLMNVARPKEVYELIRSLSSRCEHQPE